MEVLHNAVHSVVPLRNGKYSTVVLLSLRYSSAGPNDMYAWGRLLLSMSMDCARLVKIRFYYFLSFVKIGVVTNIYMVLCG